MRVKAISLWQPWASMMGLGKNYETRFWGTACRGPIAIHAAKKWTRDLKETAAEPEFADPLIAVGLDPENLPLGCIVSVGELVACHSTNRWQPPPEEEDYGDYSENRFAWEIRDISRLAVPMPIAGQQGLWEVEINR